MSRKKEYIRDDNFLIAFGKHLRKLRKDKELTQEQLAFKIDSEISQVSRMERGLLNTSISTANEIAKALDIDLKELFDFKLLDISKENPIS